MVRRSLFLTKIILPHGSRLCCLYRLDLFFDILSAVVKTIDIHIAYPKWSFATVKSGIPHSVNVAGEI